ncbi:MAG: T9SS type A sorting domain-containing protein [Saprospiraceae bacterium]
MKKQNILLLAFLFLFLNLTGQNLFTPFLNTIQETDTYQYTVTGDIDGDGLDEIVAAQRTGTNQNLKFHIFDISATGDFTLLQTLNAGDFISDPILADVDHDNLLDIVFFNYAFDIFYFKNIGGGEFETTISNFYNFNGVINAFEFFDFDNDGDDDLLISSDPIHRLLENVNDDFVFNQDIVDLNYDIGIEHLPFDLDNDNDLDLIIKSRGYIQFSYNENGVFSSPKLAMYSPTISSYSLAAGDIDQDGDIDLGYVPSNNITNFTLAKNDGSDTIFTKIDYNQFSLLNLASDIKFIDIDGDTDLDVFVGSTYSGQADMPSSAWFQNTGDTLVLKDAPSLAPDITFSGWTHFSEIEIDGDSDKEIVAVSGHQSYNRMYILEYESTNNSVSILNQFQNISNYFSYIKSADMDLDGDDDIISFNRSTNNITLFQNEIPNLNLTAEVIASGFFLDHDEGALVEDLNGDGYPDIVVNSGYGLGGAGSFASPSAYLILNQPNTNDFSDPILIQDSLLYRLEAGDFDNDGDLDLMYSSVNGHLLWVENLDNLGNYSSPNFISNNTFGSNEFTVLDGDNDGDLDVLWNSQTQGSATNLKYITNDGNGNFTNPVVIVAGYTNDLTAGDFNGDGFVDIIYRDDDDFVQIIFNQNGSIETSVPSFIAASNSFNFYSIKTSDIDLDGDIDILLLGTSGLEVLENLDNSGSFTFQYYQDPIGPTNGFTKLQVLADMDGDSDLDFVFKEIYHLYWTENVAIHPHWLTGDLIADTMINCSTDVDEIKIDDWMIIAEQGAYQVGTFTDSTGHYVIPIDSGEWIISAIPRSDYWTPCFEDSLVVMPGIGDTIVTDFYMQPNGDCGFLDWEITDNGRFRICETSTSSIEVCNYGIETLENLQLQITIDPLLTFENSSHPFTMISADSILIEIDSLVFNECKTITLDVMATCDSVALFTAPCINFEILPNDLCAPSDSLWDGSIVTVDGYCANDSIFFTLQNIGTSAMSMSAQHRVEIINDDIVMLFEADDYQLGIMEIKELSYPIQGLGLRLAADQSSNNPAVEEASVIIPSCNDLANNVVVNWLPTENGNPFTESTCNPFFGSYDPNDKRAIPTGIGMENNIQRNWELDYTIRFQNTGNDTAFLVVLRDTISEHLDLATLNVRSGSHDYFYEINPERELKITFATIELPDSTTNLAESQGFIEYSISPKSDVSFGSVIENTAYIYFDFNAPIITNTVFHTIEKPVVSTVEHIQVCQDDIYWIDTVIQNETIFVEYDSIHFIYVDVIPTIEIDTSVEVEVGSIYEGVVINTDTTFSQLFIAQNGCDSLVNYSVSIFTNTISLDFQNVKVFPNPVSEQLNIIGNESKESQNWRLVNATGMMIWEKHLDKNEMMKNISFEQFPIGVYWLEVKSESGFGIWKVVKVE